MIQMTKRIDGKHSIVIDTSVEEIKQVIGKECKFYIAKRLRGGGLERIPDDEPVILFRARDNQALHMLQIYRQNCEIAKCPPSHLEALDSVISQFQIFKLKNPTRMKLPGVTGDIDAH